MRKYEGTFAQRLRDRSEPRRAKPHACGCLAAGMGCFAPGKQLPLRELVLVLEQIPSRWRCHLQDAVPRTQPRSAPHDAEARHLLSLSAKAAHCRATDHVPLPTLCAPYPGRRPGTESTAGGDGAAAKQR
jgi:hypothetical protein